MLLTIDSNRSPRAYPTDMLICHQLLTAVWAQSAKLKANLSVLQQKYDTLVEQLNINSSNSSSAPSSDSPRAKAKRQQKASNHWEQHVATLRHRFKQGAQPGHKGYRNAPKITWTNCDFHE